MKTASFRELLAKDAARALSRMASGSVEHQIASFLQHSLDDLVSDIHIEPRDAARYLIRRRIDGFLHELQSDRANLIHSDSIRLIKQLAGLDPDPAKTPQQGFFEIKNKNKSYRIDVSALPLVNGEKLVMHWVPSQKTILNLKELGMTPEQTRSLEEKMQKPYGMIFVSGPAQNGLTTTAYSIIKRRMSPKVNILTLEDPVEQIVHGVNQVQVSAEVGLTCAAGLRAFLRQDPDVIYTGTDHDDETLAICIRAALTGRMIVGRLHAESALGALSAIMDMGRSIPSLLAESLTLVVGQRLVRKLCSHCKREHHLTSEERKNFGLSASIIYQAQPRGCEACRGTGYWGRTGIFEFLSIDEEMASAIRLQVETAKIKEIVEGQPMINLYQSGMKKVDQGVTSIEEVLQEKF